MNAIDLLSPNVIDIIVNDLGWKKLTPIQETAIERILHTDDNYILSAMTASGKTEAAFLPILSQVDFSEPGVKVLYISPLKALINDQMDRIENVFCQKLGISITKWHGDAKQGPKNRLVNHPEGIVLMTPESLEAMYQHHPENIVDLFSSLEFVIIDEIHYFLGTDRGTHLRSLLLRLRSCCQHPFRFIGLSATIGGDMAPVKEFLGCPEKTFIIKDKDVRPMDVSFEYYEEQKADERADESEEVQEEDIPEEEIQEEEVQDEEAQDKEVQEEPIESSFPEEMVSSIAEKLAGNKTLVFPNSRSSVEELCALLKDKTENAIPILTHHSCVSKEEREEVEKLAKNDPNNMAICCTSTLELGIDIGDVDQILQVFSPPGSSSLAQRAGRSGRRSGTAKIVFYECKPWGLLQTLATCQLCQRQEIEAPDTKILWYNVVLHQILSTIKEKKELSLEEITTLIHENPALSFATEEDIKNIVLELQGGNYLEDLNGKIIIGSDGGKLIGRMDSYTVFETPHNYRVMVDNKCIGELEPNRNIKEGGVVLLAARKWLISGIDRDKFLIFVKPSPRGKKPKFTSERPIISRDVEKEMQRILLSQDSFPLLDDTATEAIAQLQKEFQGYSTMGAENTPYYTNGANRLCLFPFSGTKVYNTLVFLFDANEDDEQNSLFVNMSKAEFTAACKELIDNPPDLVEMMMEKILSGNRDITAKYERFLPVELQAKMESTLKLDLEGTIDFLRSLTA